MPQTRSNSAQGLVNRAGHRVRKVVIPRDGEHRRAERDEEAVSLLVLVAPSAIGQVTGGNDQLGARLCNQPGQCRSHFWVFRCTRMKIGDMQDVYAHGRMRL